MLYCDKVQAHAVKRMEFLFDEDYRKDTDPWVTFEKTPWLIALLDFLSDCTFDQFRVIVKKAKVDLDWACDIWNEGMLSENLRCVDALDMFINDSMPLFEEA